MSRTERDEGCSQEREAIRGNKGLERGHGLERHRDLPRVTGTGGVSPQALCLPT